MKVLKKILVGGALALTMTAPLVAPKPAEAWGWRGGWHAGWGWRGGIYFDAPVVIIGPGYYGPAYRYYAPAYHWVRPYYTPSGVYVPGHWGY